MIKSHSDETTLDSDGFGISMIGPFELHMYNVLFSINANDFTHLCMSTCDITQI